MVDLTDRQNKYIDLLSSVFNMKNSKGDIFPYVPQPYQIEYHADCMIANPDFPNRLWSKSRGVGATSTTMIDALMVAHRYSDVKIPVASVTGAQSDGPIEWANWLVDNLRIGGFMERNTEIDSKCVLDNGSILFPIPGHNPDAMRNYRTVFNIYDEFAFHPYPDKVKAAGDACLSEGGQINILSTINGSGNTYYKLLINAEKLGYKVYNVPMFDPKVFNPDKTIYSQLEAGIITPISFWVDIKKLEEARLFDKTSFLQEYMCQAEDAATSFLPLELIDDCARPLSVLYQDKRYGVNQYYIGIDFASVRDISAFEIYESTPGGWIHRARLPVRKTDTTQQNYLLKELDKKYNFARVTIDMTGPGTGFFHYAKQAFGARAAGINFATRHIIDNSEAHLYRSKDKTSSKDKISIPIKRAMAVNLKLEMEQGRLVLIDDEAFKTDLNSVNYDTLDAPRTKDGHHADEFWGSALALWGKNISGDRRVRIATRRY